MVVMLLGYSQRALLVVLALIICGMVLMAPSVEAEAGIFARRRAARVRSCGSEGYNACGMEAPVQAPVQVPAQAPKQTPLPQVHKTSYEASYEQATLYTAYNEHESYVYKSGSFRGGLRNGLRGVGARAEVRQERRQGRRAKLGGILHAPFKLFGCGR